MMAVVVVVVLTVVVISVVHTEFWVGRLIKRYN